MPLRDSLRGISLYKKTGTKSMPVLHFALFYFPSFSIIIFADL